MGELRNLEKKLKKLAKELPKETIIILQREGEQFIDKNFKSEGFNTGDGLRKWKERKTTNKKGRDITRYKTNRRGRKGSLTKYGRSMQGRALLVGFKTGGDKLKNSIKTYKKNKNTIAFRSYKPYAQRHNEGLNGMPKRQFMGRSRYLDKHIHNKINKLLQKKFN